MAYSSGGYSNFGVEGCHGTFPTGINDNGEIAGYCAYASVNTATGWIDTSSGINGFSVPGAKQRFTGGINTSDVVVGYYDTDGDPEDAHGFIRSAVGTILTIDYPGAQATYLAGVSDVDGNGLASACGSYLDSSYKSHGILLYDGNLTQIDVPGSMDTAISGINDQGWFVGSYTDSKGKQWAYYAMPSADCSLSLG
jgi:hypothetical protein